VRALCSSVYRDTVSTLVHHSSSSTHLHLHLPSYLVPVDAFRAHCSADGEPHDSLGDLESKSTRPPRVRHGSDASARRAHDWTCTCMEPGLGTPGWGARRASRDRARPGDRGAFPLFERAARDPAGRGAGSQAGRRDEVCRARPRAASLVVIAGGGRLCLSRSRADVHVRRRRPRPTHLGLESGEPHRKHLTTPPGRRRAHVPAPYRGVTTNHTARGSRRYREQSTQGMEAILGQQPSTRITRTNT
jgi:hypothetical protein